MASTTKSEYIAQPCGDCCLKGSIHEGEPKGSFDTVADVQTYVSSPAEGKENGNALLYFMDVGGMGVNAKLLMDAWAERGYLALGLDYFRGDSVGNHQNEEGWDFMAWTMKHKEFTDVVVPKWAPAVKAKYGKEGMKFMAIGYCFGAPYVLESLTSGVADVGGVAHPAFLKNEHFEELKKPLFLACAEKDFTFGEEARNKAVDIMIAKGARYNLQLFSGVEHGFASRGDLKDPYQKWVKEQAFGGVVSFADFWLSNA